MLAAGLAVAACTGSSGAGDAEGDPAGEARAAEDEGLVPAGGVATEPTLGAASSVRELTDAERGAAQVLLVEASDCPVGFDQLRVVEVPYVGYDGTTRRGTVIVNADVAEDVTDVFDRLLQVGFPIERVDAIDPIPVDATSRISSNNTVGFKCRAVRGGTSWSQHAYGHAIDINPVDNPAVRDGQATPPLGADRIDRSLQEVGMIHEGDEVTAAFDLIGWGWGGRWTSHQDHMHFSLTGG
jgi:hypothetical protein